MSTEKKIPSGGSEGEESPKRTEQRRDDAVPGAESSSSAIPEAGRGDPAAREDPDGTEKPADAGEDPRLSTEDYEELVRKAEERDLYRDELLRARADFSNYQKRVFRDRPQIEEQAVRRLVLELLPVLDNFDRALEQDDSENQDASAFRRGIEMVSEMFQKALAGHGIEEIEALGKPFDPLLHEAVAQEETTCYPPNTVSTVLQKGYTQNGSVVRASRVRVAMKPEEGKPDQGEASEE